MAAENCTFVQKIRLNHIIKYLGPEDFFAHLRNFLQVLDLHIFLQKQPGHWGRGCLHFHLLLYPFFVCQMAMGAPQKNGENVGGIRFFRAHMPLMSTDYYQKGAIAVYRMQFLYIYCIL